MPLIKSNYLKRVFRRWDRESPLRLGCLLVLLIPLQQHLSTQWGPLSSGSHSIEQVTAILPAAILVKDSKGKLTPVESFRINYKFKSSYRHPETGKTMTTSELRVGDFKSAVLPPVWIESIRDNIKKGDTLLFTGILFRNANQKLQPAPQLQLIVK
ncbi:MAG: hypothetical protein ACK43J_05155 [Chitinophagaceae bacterium]